MLLGPVFAVAATKRFLKRSPQPICPLRTVSTRAAPPGTLVLLGLPTLPGAGIVVITVC